MTAAATGPRSYDTVSELKADFVKADGDCSSWNSGGATSGQCGSPLLSAVANAKTRDTFIALESSQHKNFPVLDGGDLLVGLKWGIVASEPELYADGLHGTVVHLDDEN